MIAPNIDSNDQVYQLKVTLKGSKPPIWRKVLVRANVTLGHLHEIIQAVMPWENCHLHEFLVSNEHYGEPHPEFGDMMLDEDDISLAQAARKEKKKFTYIYDFGDGWQHEILMEKILQPEERIDYPVCTAGKNACPPEDSGSLWGYYNKLAIMNDPNHPDHDDIMEWMPEDWDSTFFDIDQVNKRLKGLQ